MQIGPQTTVAEIATEYPATIRVFQQHGIDFCCGGKRSIADVCDERQVSVGTLTEHLEAAVASRKDSGGVPWHRVGLTELTEHIVERYHRPLDTELPRLTQMAQKVASVHGERHPELADVVATFQVLRDDIEPHMMKEERILFPYIARMAALAAGGAPLPASPFGTIDNPIRMMEQEHENVGQLLADLRRLTGGYVPPEDACNTFRGLLHGLAELEQETHEHIHVENNILFPRAKALEARLLTDQSTVGGTARL